MSVSTTNGNESGSQVFGSFIYQHLLLIPVHHFRDIIAVKHHGSVMIMIIYQQGNEFSGSIYTPEKIQLRFSLLIT